jgi:hypothetical protein
MRGEIIGVWPETWREIWAKLAKGSPYLDDLFADLYRELVPEPEPPQAPPPPTDLTEQGALLRAEDIAARDAYDAALADYTNTRARYEEAVGGGRSSGSALRNAFGDLVTSESDAVKALERAYGVVSSYDDEEFRNKYFQLVERFLEKYSLRYDLRRPFSLHPTLPGVFARLIRELKEYAMRDADLNALMREFEESVRDLRTNTSTGNIKTCIAKQINLIEAMGSRCPGVTETTLGRICNQVGSWPHAKLKEAMKDIYSFASDYPGIRHGGTAANQLREIEMRDLVAVSVVLAGFSPYLTDQINSDTVYRGR